MTWLFPAGRAKHLCEKRDLANIAIGLHLRLRWRVRAWLHRRSRWWCGGVHLGGWRPNGRLVDTSARAVLPMAPHPHGQGCPTGMTSGTMSCSGRWLVGHGWTRWRGGLACFSGELRPLESIRSASLSGCRTVATGHSRGGEVGEVGEENPPPCPRARRPSGWGYRIGFHVPSPGRGGKHDVPLAPLRPRRVLEQQFSR